MQPPRPASLRGALRSADDLDGRQLLGIDAGLTLASLLDHSCLGRPRTDIAGRNVLLATGDQLVAALVLTELDGVAARIVLCPPDLKGSDFPVIIDRAAVDCVVTDLPPHAFANDGRVETIGCGQPPVPAADTRLAELPTEWLLLTSGTTGVPKMVQHSFAGLTAAIAPRPGGTRPTVWATFYDIRRYGGLQIFLRGMLGTGSLVLSSAGEPISDHLRRLARAGVTHLSGTPSHWRRALMSPEIAGIAPDYVRLSGEIADQAVLDALRQAFPQASIGHAFASTEAGVGFEVDDGLTGFPASFVGRTDAEVALKVEDGSLRIRSMRSASRYVGTADATLADPDGFIDTGDMVEARGDRLHFVGRRGGIINVGGLKVHPEEVEAVINRHGGVRMSLVTGRKNPITGAIVVAAVVLKDEGGGPCSDLVRGEILAACRKDLPPYKVPVILSFVPSLAITPAGKLVRAYA